MNKMRLNEAVPPMPDHFKRAMTDTLGGLEEMKKRHKFTASVTVALAAMLALAGMACAAQYGLLDFIFSRGLPGQDSEKSVHSVEKAAEGEYMDFTVHDYIFDGTDLYANWTLEMHTDEPLVLITTGFDADFPRDVYCDQNIPEGIAVNNPLTSAFAGGVWEGMNRGHFYDFAPETPFDVSVKLALVRPDEDALMLKSCEQGDYPRRPVWFGSDDVVSWSWGYYDHGNESGSDDGEHCALIDARAAEVGYHEAWLEYFEEYGFGEVVEKMEVQFTVVPEAFSGKYLEKSETFSMKDFDLIVEKAEFTGFNGRIHLRMKYAQPVETFPGRSVRFTAYADGQKLDFAQQMDSSAVATEFTCDFWSEGGCSLLPEEITIETNAGESVTVKLK